MTPPNHSRQPTRDGRTVLPSLPGLVVFGRIQPSAKALGYCHPAGTFPVMNRAAISFLPSGAKGSRVGAVDSMHTFMNIGHSLAAVSVALSALFIAGCATDREAQTQSIYANTSLLSVTNSVPGSIYEVRVYVVTAGDTVAKIAHQFGISITGLKAINPGLNPTHLKIGQKIRISEQLVQ